MLSGHGFERGAGGVSPRQEVVNLTAGMAVDDPGGDVGEIGVRLDPAELACFDERGDDGPVLATGIGAGEQCAFAIESDRTDCALDHVAVDLDAAVVEEAGQSRPARQRIALRVNSDCGAKALTFDRIQVNALVRMVTAEA